MAIDDPVAFAPPPAFGPFRVLHQIGIGALGPVFRTYEPTRDRLVAVKVFRLDITPEQAQLLADELAMASDAGLFHPSIVEPIAAGVEGTVAYRAEEYVAAESLDAAIRHYAPAPLDKTLPFLTQLAGAIDFARTAGIGHGSLHLRDIFVTPEEARASGFGVVESLERMGLRAPVRRPYSAPERIAGTAWGTPADVFSLAAITYELLTGRRPAGTGDQLGPLTGDHLLEFGAGMRTVLARAMDEDPARRYPTALAFASALEAAARGGRVTEAVTAVGEITEAAPAPRAVPLEDAEPGLTLAAAAALGAPSVADDRGLTLEFDSEQDVADPVHAETAAERDDDAAHYELAHSGADHQDRMLFDEEAAADMGFDRPEREVAAAEVPARLWEADPEPIPEITRPAKDRDTGRYGYAVEPETDPYAPADSVPVEPERPRAAVLPIAVTLILGLLIGFAAGYWTGGRDAGNRTPISAAAGSPPPGSSPAKGTPAHADAAKSGTATDSAKPAAAGEGPKTGGQPYTDHPLRPAAPPVVPDEGSRTTPREDRAATTVAAATSGRLLVTSTPSRATVTVNGRWRGRTPLTLTAMKFGDYTVRVAAPGFATSRDDVALSASEPVRNVAVRLQRSPAPAPPPARSASATHGVPAPAGRSGAAAPLTGSIYVDSRPIGARILVDGKFAGTTPARIPEVAIGSHVVRLELPEHRAWTASTRISAGEESRVTGSLERIP